MKFRLRHPIRSIREPFGTAGLIVACIALIAALGGTALAAKGVLTGKQKKEVEKIAKKFAGKPGAPGAQGAQGNPGPAGAPGKDGTNGSDGTSVTSKPILTSSTVCNHQGGTELTSASGSEKLCNGKEGSPWSAGGTLPEGQTETGAWSVSATAAAGFEFVSVGTLSFPIPLAAPLEPQGGPAQRYIGLEEGEGEAHQSSFIPSECQGTSENPAASPAHLCIFATEAEHLFSIISFNPGKAGASAGTTGTTGSLYKALASESGAVNAHGTWAVSAE